MRPSMREGPPSPFNPFAYERSDMSYLNPLRLHFAGKFQASTSTVNNDASHYNNATFLPEYQLLQSNGIPNGWWNPMGDSVWRFINCKVTGAWLGDGSRFDASDYVLQCIIADSDRQAPAKLVDLDGEQQTVSEIWGLEVRIYDPMPQPDGTLGATLLRGRFEPTGFMDIWDRATGFRGDGSLGAIYQSVLTDLEWADPDPKISNLAKSTFLTELQNHAKDGLLSIKFNVDGFDANFYSPDFARGRVVGTIGPASLDEPKHFTVGRQFMAVESPNSNFFSPQGNINFCTAVVDTQRGKILLDLGNALHTTSPGGPIEDLGPITMAYQQPPVIGQTSPQWAPLGSISYTGAGWYEKTAGIVEFPVDRTLTAEETEAVMTNTLALLLPGPGGSLAPAIQESPDGLYVKADKFIYRLNPGEEAQVKLYASRFGLPYAGATVRLWLDALQLQGGAAATDPGSFAPPDPGSPPSSLGYNESAGEFKTFETGSDGIAVAKFQASAPGNPRRYLDGQVYGVRPTLEATPQDTPQTPLNPWNFVSILVFDDFTPDDPITWWGSLQPIFQQYANLYPVMSKFLDLSDYDSVCANRDLLLIAFKLPISHPSSMPVQRDLSAAKRAAILKWLTDLGPDGKPLLGTQPPPSAGVAGAALTGGFVAPKPDPETIRKQLLGGKTAAASRRLALRSPNNRS